MQRGGKRAARRVKVHREITLQRVPSLPGEQRLGAARIHPPAVRQPLGLDACPSLWSSLKLTGSRNVFEQKELVRSLQVGAGV